MENPMVFLLFILLCGCHVNTTPTLRVDNYLKNVSDGEARETAAALTSSLASEELLRAIERTVTAAISQSVKDVPTTTSAPTLIPSKQEIANVVSAAVKQAMKELTPPTTPAPAPRCGCDEQIAITVLPEQPSEQNVTEYRSEVTMSVVEEFPTTPMLTSLTPPHCAAGYKFSEVTGYCYKGHTKGEKWDDADQICRDDGAMLAFANSDEECQLLVKLMKADSPTFDLMQYGMRRSNETNDWLVSATGEMVADSEHNVWQDQALFTDPKWAYGRLTDKCTLDAGLNDLKRYYICKKAPEGRPQPKTGPMCDERAGYKLSNVTGNCYKVYTEAQTWVDADYLCRIHGALLSVANSKEEADLIKGLLKAAVPDFINAQYGMRRRKGDVWKDLKGNNIEDSGYNVFAKDQHLYTADEWGWGRFTKDGELDAGLESLKRPYVCERVPKKITNK